MVLGTRPKAGIKETGEAVTRPTPRDKASGCGTAEGGARQAKPRAVSEPRAARPPLPRRARSPLPSPRPPQNVRGSARRSRKSKPGRGGQTRPGSPSHRHPAHPRRPPAAPRPMAPRTAARPRGPRRRGEGSRAVGMGVTLSFRRCQVTARPRPRPRPGPGVPAAHLLADLCPLALPSETPSAPSPDRTRTRASPDGAARARHPPLHRARPTIRGFQGSQRWGVPPRTGRGRGRRGGDRTVDSPLPRGASGPALTSAPPPGRWQQCAGSPRLPDRGTRLTSARRTRTVGCPRKREGPGGEKKQSGSGRGLNSSPLWALAA